LQAICQIADAHEQLISLASIVHLRDWRWQNRYPVGVSTASRAGEVHLARAENLYMGYLDYVELWLNGNCQPGPAQ